MRAVRREAWRAAAIVARTVGRNAATSMAQAKEAETAVREA